MLRPDDITAPFLCKTVEEGGIERVRPYLPVGIGEVAVALDWDNTTVRTFADHQFDHVELRLQEGVKGIRFGADLIQMFVTYQYPRKWDPVVDNSTLEWYIQTELRDLPEELDDLLGGE